MSDVTPVAVSLWVARTALIAWPVSAASAASYSWAGMPAPQPASITCTLSPWRRHSSIQRCENMPLRAASTVSPGDSVLVTAASQPAVPVAGKRKTCALSLFRTRRTLARTGVRISPNSAERWSIVGMSQALRIASGMFVGPGMKTGFCKLMDRFLLD
jgi:hypothetical protein